MNISEESFALTEEEKRGKKKKKILIIVAIIVLILLALFILYKLGYIGGQQEEVGFIIGAGVKEGMLKIEEKIADEGANGTAAMSISLNAYPTFKDGQSEGNLNIVNAVDNTLYMEVEICLDNTGEVIYQSGAIPPNHYIDNGKLTKILEKGEYKATAYVTIFDSENLDNQYNSANFDLVVKIEN